MNDTLKAAGRIGAELGAAKAEVARLRGLLREAAEDIEAWGAYASEYFQEKHDLAGCAAKYRAAGVGDQGDEGAELAAIAAMPMRTSLSKQPEPTDTYTAVDMATAAAQGFRDGQAAVEQAPAQDELRARCAEILEWQQTGLLPGDALLAFAASQPYASDPNRLQMAEADTARQAYRFVLQAKTAPAQTEQQPEQSEELAWEVLKAATDTLDRRAAPHAWVSQAWAAGSKVITSRRAALSAQGGEA